MIMIIMIMIMIIGLILFAFVIIFLLTFLCIEKKTTINQLLTPFYLHLTTINVLRASWILH